MTNPNWIARFNPYQMAAETVRALAVGREALLAQVLGDIRSRLDGQAADRHLLLTGPRGAGKSYFLRLLEIEFAGNFGADATFVLLPEEQPNLFGVANLVANILERLGDKPESGLTSTWEEDGEEAALALARLMERWQVLRPEARLLVIGVENFDAVLKSAFADKPRESVLRKLLQSEPRLMLVATTLDDAFDNDSGKRLFRNFAHLHLAPWSPDQHADYLGKRAELAHRETTSAMRGKIRAYARFTGGSPRIGAALADLLLEEADLHGAAVNLQTLVDDLTDYYRNLWERVPPNSRKLLDALIREGEPCSQSALAARVQAQQNQISRAFQWLRDMGYVREITEKAKGRDKLYQVGDRLFVQFYRMRYIHTGAPTPLIAMSDLLADLYDAQEKFDEARKLMTGGHAEDAYFMNCLGLRDFAVDERKLPDGSRTPERVAALHELLVLKSQNTPSVSGNLAFFKALLERCKNNTSLQRTFEDLLAALMACTPPFACSVTGVELAGMIENTLVYTWPEKIVLVHILTTIPKKQSWQGIYKLIQDSDKWEGDNENKAQTERKRVQFERDQLYLPFVAQLMWIAFTEEGGAKNAIELMKQVKPETLEQLGVEMSRQADTPTISSRLRVGQTPFNEAISFWRHFGSSGEAPSSLALVGVELMTRGRYEDALTVFQNVLLLCKEFDSEKLAAIAVGGIGQAYFLLNQTDEAWKVIDSYSWKDQDDFYYVLRAVGSTVAFRAIEDRGAAFSLATTLLEGLAERSTRYSSVEALWQIFISFLTFGLPASLFRDVLEEASTIFGELFVRVGLIFRTTLDFLQRGTEREDWLVRQEPDLATTVRALLEESGLDAEQQASYPA